MTELEMIKKMAEVSGMVKVFLAKEGYSCSVNSDFVKKNGCYKPALVIKPEMHPVGVVVYFDEDDFSCSSFEVAVNLTKAYLSQILSKEETKNLAGKFYDKDFVMENVFLVLIEKAKNAEFLAKNVVYKDFGIDTGLVLAVKIRLGETDDGSQMITYYPENICQDALNISPETLFYAAKANTIADAQTISMDEFMSQQIGMEIETPVPTYILTNKSELWGAGSICHFSELLRLREKLGADLVILPSSVNEVLIVPYDGENSDKYFNIVKLINGDRNCLPEEDILTNAVLYYNGVTVSKMK